MEDLKLLTRIEFGPPLLIQPGSFPHWGKEFAKFQTVVIISIHLTDHLFVFIKLLRYKKTKYLITENYPKGFLKIISYGR